MDRLNLGKFSTIGRVKIFFKLISIPKFRYYFLPSFLGQVVRKHVQLLRYTVNYVLII